MNGTDETKAFADRLSDLLNEAKEKGKNHRQVATEGGIGSHASLSKYTADTAEAGLNSLVKLARYFDVSIDYLVGLTNVRSRKSSVRKIVEYTGLDENAINALHEKQIALNARNDFTQQPALEMASWFLCKPDYWKALHYLFYMLFADAQNASVEAGKSKLEFLENGMSVNLFGDEAGNYMAQQAERLLSQLIQEIREFEEVHIDLEKLPKN